MIKIHNTETNEIIEREMTNNEFAQYEVEEAKTKADAIKHKVEAAAKAALLERLGITEDEARLLLG